jgi:hypothetical protein
VGQLVDGKWMTGEVLRRHDEKGLYFKRPRGLPEPTVILTGWSRDSDGASLVRIEP